MSFVVCSTDLLTSSLELFPKMFAAQPRARALGSGIRHVPTVPQAERLSGAGKVGGFARQSTNVSCFRSMVPANHQTIRAVISSEDSKTSGAAKLVEDAKGSNGSLTSASVGGSIEVRAAVTIRKKMKENMSDKFEEQWESFINGIGRGILIQLISEDIDPGKLKMLTILLNHKSLVPLE